MSLVLNSVREAAVMEQIWVVQYPANSLGASQGSPNVRGEPSCPRLVSFPEDGSNQRLIWKCLLFTSVVSWISNR